MSWLKTSFYKTKLFFECLFFYMKNRKIFKYQRIGFLYFYLQMEYFIIVDPHIKDIKSLWDRMERGKPKISKEDQAMEKALRPPIFKHPKEVYELAKILQDEEKRRNRND